MNEALLSETAHAILDYLRRYPEAQDTLEGIVQWWLPEQHFTPRVATIREALQELLDAEFISEHRGKDAQISYRITTHGLQKSEKHRRRNPATDNDRFHPDG
jgi:Fe2+ or Zn2+ uptake regulation protein